MKIFQPWVEWNINFPITSCTNYAFISLIREILLTEKYSIINGKRKKESNCYVWIHTTLPDQTENPNFGTKAAWSPVFINLKKITIYHRKVRVSDRKCTSIQNNNPKSWLIYHKIITQNPNTYHKTINIAAKFWKFKFLHWIIQILEKLSTKYAKNASTLFILKKSPPKWCKKS